MVIFNVLGGTPTVAVLDPATQPSLEVVRPRAPETVVSADNNLLFVVTDKPQDLEPLRRHLSEQGGLASDQRIIHVPKPAQLTELISKALATNSEDAKVNNIGIISLREDGDLGNSVIPQLAEIIEIAKDKVVGIYLAAKDTVQTNLLRVTDPGLLKRLMVDATASEGLQSIGKWAREFANLVLFGKQAEPVTFETPKPVPVATKRPAATFGELLKGGTVRGREALERALAEQRTGRVRSNDSEVSSLDPREVAQSIFKPDPETLSLQGSRAFNKFVDKVFRTAAA